MCYSRACRDAAVFRLLGKSGVVAVANTRSVMREPVPVQGPGPVVFEPLQFAAGRDAADGVERRAEACAEIGGEPSERTPEFYKSRPCLGLIKRAAEIIDAIIEEKTEK